MSQSFLQYKLRDGYVHHWLVAGPQLIPVEVQNGRPGLNNQQIAARYWQPDSGIETQPCEQARFTVSGPETAAAELSWRYISCDDDHLLDLAGAHPPHHYLRSWAYTELIAPVDQTARLTLHAFGPAQVWLNGQPVLRQDGFSVQLPHGLATEVNMVKGANRVLVRLEQWVFGATPYAIALHILGVKQNKLKVRLPTLNSKTDTHQIVERLARQAYIEHDLYAGPEHPQLSWPGSIKLARRLMIRVQKPAGAIVWEAQPVVKAGASLRLLEPTTVKDGAYKIKIMAEFEQFIRGLRVSHTLDVNLLHSNHIAEPQGELPARAGELLQHTAWWTEGLFSQIALMRLGLWHQVNEAEIRRTIDLALSRSEGYDKLMVGLLLMVYRFASVVSFPQALAQQLETCLLGFDYEGDEPIDNDISGIAEDLAILKHTINILAGQLYPNHPFAGSSQLGKWYKARGEQEAMAWLKRRAQGGFAAWGSGEGFEAMLLGLIALVDHAASEMVSDMAAAITDKLLFTLAINTFNGVFGSTRGSTKAASITDGRMEPTSGISRLLWGVGCWNQHMAAGLALACSQKYQCPLVLQFIALDRPEGLWCRERHVVSWHAAGDEMAPGQTVNKVTYKTPDYMLCSAQNYRPGESGLDEHIWQATMSPSALVFVNHPGCMNQQQAYRPNFWCGNRVLPRVAQWRDLILALYYVPDDDWLGYTHAHFPTAAFDEYTLKRGWAFARTGNAYLALTASGGMTLVKSGPGAYRELRSVARQTVWLCQMGRAAQDSTFAKFQNEILALPLTFDGLAVSLVSLRGDPITFGWLEPFTVKETELPLTNFKHYESPYCTCDLSTSDMDIKYGEWTLRLNLDTLD
jgi:hypothetical protein